MNIVSKNFAPFMKEKQLAKRSPKKALSLPLSKYGVNPTANQNPHISPAFSKPFVPIARDSDAKPVHIEDGDTDGSDSEANGKNDDDDFEVVKIYPAGGGPTKERAYSPFEEFKYTGFQHAPPTKGFIQSSSILKKPAIPKSLMMTPSQISPAPVPDASIGPAISRASLSSQFLAAGTSTFIPPKAGSFVAPKQNVAGSDQHKHVRQLISKKSTHLPSLGARPRMSAMLIKNKSREDDHDEDGTGKRPKSA